LDRLSALHVVLKAEFPPGIDGIQPAKSDCQPVHYTTMSNVSRSEFDTVSTMALSRAKTQSATAELSLESYCHAGAWIASNPKPTPAKARSKASRCNAADYCHASCDTPNARGAA
jgi:hypothetical protein